MQKVIIIGSGLSGLSAAYYLDKSLYKVSIFEKESIIGGRVKSFDIDGFTCDAGFQVLLNNYDEVKKLGIYNSLKLKYFDSGAQIFTESGILSLYNPLKHPFKFLKSNLFKIFRIKDFLSVVYFLFKTKEFRNKNLKKIFNKNFSTNAQRLFFYPFFRGIFLSKDLKVSPKFFLKIFRKFALGKASLPKNGIGDLAKKMSERVDVDISLNHEAIKLEGNKVFFKNGKNISFDLIIFASLPKFINEVVETKIEMDYNFNKTIYLKSSINMLDKSILLVPDDKYNINSIQCLSNISSNYSKSGEHLYSISTIDKNVEDKTLMKEFEEILGINTTDFHFVKSFNLKFALPSSIITDVNLEDIHLCGDWTCEPSIDGAIKSGRILAEQLNKEANI